MQPETVASLFAVCLIAGLIGSLALFTWVPTRARLVDSAPKIAALVAVSATAGSLYFSEVADFVPCELCWFQRVAMYPLALILPVAALRRDRSVMNYAFLLAAAGLITSAYHIQVQWFPERSNSCALDDPCSAKWVEAFGVFTIPQMAGMSFLLIVMLAVASTFDQRRGSQRTPTPTSSRQSDTAEHVS